MARPLRRFGPDGPEVPAIGAGTYLTEAEPGRSVAALRAGMEMGYLHIDTAECYASGRVEQLVADAIEGRRDGVFLVSKVLPGNACRDGVVASCERSLRRLRTDRLDCLLLHHPSHHPPGDTVAGFEELMERGLIRSYGLSNFEVSGLENFVAAGGRVSCLQSRYNLLDRHAEETVIPWCEERGIAFVAHTPLARSTIGFHRGGSPSPLEGLAASLQRTPWQVALAYLVRRPGALAIPKSSSPERMRENLEAADAGLPDGAIDEVSRLFPVRRKI